MKTFSTYLLISILFYSSCGKPFPTFNPFDDLFQIDTEKVLSDQSLYIEGDGGYSMYAKDMGDYFVYYSIFAGHTERVLSKGLFIPLDTIGIGSKEVPIVIIDQHAKATYLGERKVDTARVDSTFAIYGFKRLNSTRKNWFYENRFGKEISISRSWWYHREGDRLTIIRKMFYDIQAPEDDEPENKGWFLK